ncbi:Protein of unknown function [Pseudomonas sp. NFPP10]|uniref:DUF1090 domain-containing protein n=1 Tax=unclassified Pseudomonas TaxID=196821 RepID=UPI00088D7BDC|nr:MULTISPECIES: DUF1090 domain-containing protein [unclassified Pseudomonas]SDA10878.1 Protein of unknown function [Pseudomonas sp. NFPP12]SEK54623.1 Protein of unknown function [Pseudomonas sp. NFPP10]SFH89503.1 Protein of unknown function [Pseudomonas sp. NFPP08]SFM11092.1 Protein of unknown function [Pseudomonas sp. NFPP05]SFX01740.1 Protein of unknown function [Pseudomonas sp. NFPP09]
MKLHHSLFLALPLLVYSSLSLATPNCAIKEQKIRTQLEYATHYGNIHRIAGLNRALTNVQTYCYDGYKNGYTGYDYTSATKSTTPSATPSYAPIRHSQVAEKQRKVEKSKEKLQEAQLKGKPSKIAKQQRKLDEAEFELRQAQSLEQQPS